MKKSGAEIVISFLERKGIKTITGIPGGMNLPLYNALYKSQIRHILARHEQGAGFIAQGMARSTGKTAVCFATSGPGVTNLLTAIADAKSDSVPLLAITGQVPVSMIGTDAFQEIDTYGIYLPVTKHNYLVRKASELPEILEEAFELTTSGRPGPVLIDIPKNVQNEIIDFEGWPDDTIKTIQTEPDRKIIFQIAQRINESKKPVLYIGGGVTISGASFLVYELAKKNSIPVVSTLMGLDAFPASDPLSLGMLGMHGAKSTNLLLNDSDLLIALGARFDDRATGKIEEFCPDADIIHIDIDKAEIDKIRKSNISLEGDLLDVLQILLPNINMLLRKEWFDHVLEIKEKYLVSAADNPVHPLNLIKTVGSLVDPESIITTDVGQHQMWVAQAYPFQNSGTFLTSGGLGTMGFGLPVAIGAALVNPGKKVICFSGDGSILMNIQELATLADLKLDVKIIVLNNNHLGLVRQQQELFYNENYIASKFDTKSDFAGIARSFGIKGIDFGSTENWISELDNLLNVKGPVLINIPVDHKENVLPMVPPGAANTTMIV